MNKLTPRPEQLEAIEAVIRDKRHLCKAERGAGKSLIGVEAILRSGAKVSAVCAPLNTYSGWRDTFARQSDGQVVLRIINSRKAGKQAFEDLALGVPGVYFIGWERFRMYDWQKFPVDFYVYDEVHRAANRRTSTHAAMKSARRAEYALGLSATLTGNLIQGLWAIQHSFWPDRSITPAYWNWVSKYMRTVRDQYQGKKIEGERNPGAVWEALPSKSSFASPFQEDPLIYNIEVPLLPAQRKIYDRFEQQAVVWLGDRPLVADLPAVMRLRLRQICLAVPSIRYTVVQHRDPDTGEVYEDEFEEVYFEDDAKSTKADAVMEVLSDLHADTPEPVLIFTHSRKFATMLTLRLQEKGYRARQFVGGMSQEERQWKIDNFGIEFDILVATIATISEGVDGLQHRCHIEFWISLDDSRVLNKQARGRLSRLGQTKTVLRYMFMAADTVEQRQISKLEADQAQLDLSFNTTTEMEVAA